MPRKLKTYRTSLGFFDQAVAAPSMKAALEAWGADSNLFHQGMATQTDDPEIVAAAMEKPGIVLKRPVGSNGRFKEHAELPTNLVDDGKSGPKRRPAKTTRQQPRELDDQQARKAAIAYEKEKKRREAERRKEEAARERERERREKAVAKAQAALDGAQREHEEKAAAIEAERASLDERAQAEDERWARHKEKLEAALRKARQ